LAPFEKYASLFASAKLFCSCKFAEFAEAGERKAHQTYALAREECNKYDLIGAPCF
jgi:hypothetical protein